MFKLQNDNLSKMLFKKINYRSLKSILKNNKTLFKNFSYLAILQALNILLPLITLPYLLITIGAEFLGLIAFASAVISYLNIITDFGFNITATREISIHRTNTKKINEIFSSVMTIKLFLTICCFIILLLFVFLIPKLHENWEIYILTYGIVLGQVFFPVWFFQGIEEMKYITFLNVISKLIFTISIFIFVKTQEDYLLVPLLNSLGFIVVAIYSFIIITKRFKVKFNLKNTKTVKKYYKKSWYVFISNIAVSLYTTSTLVFLGFFANNTIVGYYSIADKLINAIKQLSTPITQALFPYISRKIEDSVNSGLRIIQNVAVILSLGSFLLFVFIFYFSDEILFVLFENEAKQSVVIFKILSLTTFLVVIDGIFGTLLMLTFNKNKEYSRIILKAGILNIILLLLLVPNYLGIGAAVAVLIVEIYITISFVVFTQKNGLKIIRKKIT